MVCHMCGEPATARCHSCYRYMCNEHTASVGQYIKCEACESGKTAREKMERIQREIEESQEKRRSETEKAENPCFIATAAYDNDAPEVCLLRKFRDERLLGSKLGRAAVHAYYTTSPPLASVIQKSNVLRRITRAILRQVVRLAKCFVDG